MPKEFKLMKFFFRILFGVLGMGMVFLHSAYALTPPAYYDGIEISFANDAELLRAFHDFFNGFVSVNFPEILIFIFIPNLLITTALFPQFIIWRRFPAEDKNYRYKKLGILAFCIILIILLSLMYLTKKIVADREFKAFEERFTIRFNSVRYPGVSEYTFFSKSDWENGLSESIVFTTSDSQGAVSKFYEENGFREDDSYSNISEEIYLKKEKTRLQIAPTTMDGQSDLKINKGAEVKGWFYNF